MANVEYELRCAKPKDMIAVTQMIQDLVEEEEMPHGPKVTSTDMVRDGFLTTSPFFRCLVAEICNGPIIGFTVYYFYFSGRFGRGVKVDDMLVAKCHRNHGVGKAMFNAICKYAMESECTRIEFQVLEWNPARRFYQHCGATEVTKKDKWCLYRIYGDTITKAASEACI